MDSSPVIVITGASSGIGATFAALASLRGANLALVARRRQALDAVAEPFLIPAVHERATVRKGE